MSHGVVHSPITHLHVYTSTIGTYFIFKYEKLAFKFQNVQNMIKEALLKYDADKLGLADFALESLGMYYVQSP